MHFRDARHLFTPISCGFTADLAKFDLILTCRCLNLNMENAVLACFDHYFSYFDLILATYKSSVGSYNSPHLIYIRQLHHLSLEII